MDDVSLSGENVDEESFTSNQIVLKTLTNNYVKYTINNIRVPDTNSILFMFYFQENRDILLDNIEFIKQGSMTNIFPNGGFEDWDNQLMNLFLGLIE